MTCEWNELNGPEVEREVAVYKANFGKNRKFFRSQEKFKEL